jgi:ribosomal protein L23
LIRKFLKGSKMKIKPILTEKSLEKVQDGKYSFWVPVSWTKKEIRAAISNLFGVTVGSVKTIRRRSRKKAMVTIGDKETIDLFGEDKKKK